MNSFQAVAKNTAKYQVLIATASEETSRLLQPLQKLAYPEGLAETGDLFSQRQKIFFHTLDSNVVDQVMRSRQTEWPISLVIVDVQPGTETKAEQIISAIYYSDPALGVIVLLADGATLSQTLLDMITYDPRLTFIQMPATLAQIFQVLKMMLAVCQSQQRSLETESSKAGSLFQHSDTHGTNDADHPAMHLEVVGSLTSGIAHEFNNVLTVIQSQMDMAMKQAGSLPGVVHLLNQVMETARNASALSRKLVSFTPDEASKPQSIDLKTALDEEVTLLSKTLGENIRLTVNHADHLPNVWADASTISHLIINVALHARNSMIGGGMLQIATCQISHQVGSKYARLFPEAEHGEYVMLTIEDPNPADDTDMPDPSKVVVALPNSAQRAANDRLAWIQRTIQAAGGALNVTLLPGMIRIYQMLFPLAKDHLKEEALAEPFAATLAPIVSLQETFHVQPATVLVVDDDDTICMIMSQVLATEKHRVLTAKSADEAWQQWCQHRSTIKLLITDINMPGGANGVTLGHAIQEQDGSVPVIYTSGHRAVQQYAELEIGSNYLPKPFGMNDLLQVANRALAAHGQHGLS